VIFEQHYLDCLSQASYLVGDERTGRAVVVDPRRDVADYLASAEEHGLRIELVIETHFHADFLSGHLELARATGAEIGVGAAGRPSFPHRPLHDGERIELGDVVLEVRSTPGHTPESISIVVWDLAVDAETPYGVLTGDTLFIGDVGRPDLLASVGVTAEELGRSLYHSLRDQLLTLPDATKVFPAHGAGSACGKQLSTETVSTIGEQRATNYALADMGVEEFIDVVTEGQPAAPGYFSYDATLNKSDRLVFDEEAPAAPLTLEQVLELQAAGAVVIDTRDAATFAAGHLAGSINVALDGRFAEFAGSVALPTDTLVAVTEPGDEPETRVRLARIGFDRLAGVLAEPYREFQDHPEVVRRASRLTAEEFVDRLGRVGDLRVVDVRTHGEHSLGSVAGADVVPVAQLRQEVESLTSDPDTPVVVFCAGGYRSSLAASLLRSAGLADVSDVLGGYGAIAPLLDGPDS
jgi:glyoxylase-like metal-dependent hydrolase (beta-lactamase superfamily II)/rhodanese-related sulfurtransferase